LLSWLPSEDWFILGSFDSAKDCERKKEVAEDQWRAIANTSAAPKNALR
jgi:hypothetical protein